MKRASLPEFDQMREKLGGSRKADVKKDKPERFAWPMSRWEQELPRLLELRRNGRSLKQIGEMYNYSAERIRSILKYFERR